MSASPDIGNIDLRCGHAIGVRRIVLEHTYAGLLEGRPNDDLNRRILDGAEMFCREYLGHSAHVVIQPKMTTQSAKGRAWTVLPPVKVAALFVSYRPVKDRGSDGSALAIMWFQGAFEPLVGDGIKPLLEAVDWTRHAEDWQF